MSDLVSVIIPTFNRASIIGETIQSAIDQTHRNVEILVIDDGSTDDTAEVVEKFARRDSRVSYHRENKAGVGPARQSGFDRSHGPYIQFLDSDDLLAPQKIALQVDALAADPSAGVAYGPTYRFRDDWRAEEPDRMTGCQIGEILPAMLAGRAWNTMSALYRREICEQAGRWSDLTAEEDWEFDVRVALLRPKVLHVPGSESYYRMPENPRVLTEDDLDRKFRDRATAHTRIAGHALSAGIDPRMPEVIRFARYTFLLARQCAERGLETEAKGLIAAAASLTTQLDVRAYRIASTILGWKRTAKVAKMLDRLR